MSPRRLLPEAGSVSGTAPPIVRQPDSHVHTHGRIVLHDIQTTFTDGATAMVIGRSSAPTSTVILAEHPSRRRITTRDQLLAGELPVPLQRDEAETVRRSMQSSRQYGAYNEARRTFMSQLSISDSDVVTIIRT